MLRALPILTLLLGCQVVTLGTSASAGEDDRPATPQSPEQGTTGPSPLTTSSADLPTDMMTSSGTTGGSTSTAPGSSTGEPDAPPDPYCGDGRLDPGEECDDGNDNDLDDCHDCLTAFCGDAITQWWEECDDGADDYDKDFCLPGCIAAKCGDGVVQDFEEACDDGNLSDEDACTSLCKLATCGDGETQAGEECDDGNLEETDLCTSMCLSAACGDGWLQAGEECDDANAIDADACSNLCKQATCTDGAQNHGETDVDCGGPCDECLIGDKCDVNTDCQSHACEMGTCAALALNTPECPPAVVDANTVWLSVASPRCGCHQGGSGGLFFGDATTLKANMVEVPATTAEMLRVTPSDLDLSYLLYKALNQHDNVEGGGGNKMPPVGVLEDFESCLLISWVKSGAT